jgi:predicted naringenin-chalcone synthase
MSLSILGVGTSVPPCALSQGRTAELASQVSGHSPAEAERLAFLYGLTGIRRRHVSVLDEGEAVPEPFVTCRNGPTTGWRMDRYASSVPPIALKASRAALDDSGLAREAITHLVTVSCTGFVAPGFDIALIRGLDLDPSIQRTHVGFMGCHGALNGLRVARALAASEPGSRVLLCAAELCSLHYSFGPGADQSVSNALFADGAAAVVVGHGAASPWSVLANGSVLVPGTESAMGWRIEDHGFVMTLAPEVPRLIREHLRPWLAGWLEAQGVALGAVGSWAVHPGGPKILDAVQAALGLGKDALADSREVLAGYGNMSSPTVLFILERLIRRDAPRPCVALGFGPGLVVEAALIGGSGGRDVSS